LLTEIIACKYTHTHTHTHTCTHVQGFMICSFSGQIQQGGCGFINIALQNHPNQLYTSSLCTTLLNDCLLKLLHAITHTHTHTHTHTCTHVQGFMICSFSGQIQQGSCSFINIALQNHPNQLYTSSLCTTLLNDCTLKLLHAITHTDTHTLTHAHTHTHTHTQKQSAMGPTLRPPLEVQTASYQSRA